MCPMSLFLCIILPFEPEMNSLVDEENGLVHPDGLLCISNEIILLILSHLASTSLWIVSNTCRTMRQLTAIVYHERRLAQITMNGNGDKEVVHREHIAWELDLGYFGQSNALLILCSEVLPPEHRDTLLCMAAKAGHLEALTWLVATQGWMWGFDVIVAAARHGQVEMLEWLRSSYFHPSIQCSTALRVLQSEFKSNALQGVWGGAVEHGELGVLIWACDHMYFPPKNSYDLEKASRKGHVHIVEWIATQAKMGRYSISFPSNHVWKSVARLGHLDLLKEFQREIIAELKGSDYGGGTLLNGAALGNQLEVLKWLRSIGVKWCFNALQGVIHHGFVDLLDWALGNGAEMPCNPMCEAITSGTTTMIDWVRGKGVQWFDQERQGDEYKASIPHIHMLEHLHKLGCPWNASVSRFAAHNSFETSEALVWLLEHGCPWQPIDRYEVSLESSEKYLDAHGYQLL